MSTEHVKVEVPEIAFKWGYHKMSRNEMSKDMLARIQKGKHVSFAELTPGTYMYDQRKEVFIIGKLTPAKRQAEAIRLGPGGQRFSTRLHSGNYSYGKFVALSDEIVSMLDVKHEAIIEEIVSREGPGPVPPMVRREYPQFFVEVPERFGIKDSAYESCFRETPRERVKNALLREGTRWGGAIPSAESMEEIIQGDHASMTVLYNERAQALSLNRDIGNDYDRCIQERKNNIDFYRWLIPYFEVGGVFYVEPKKEK